MKKNVLVTVLTTTYNRSNNLFDLYNSLNKQSSYNFKWIVVDDGSTDDTTSSINKLINKTHKFEIEYFKLKNGGKHRALNYIFSKLDTDLTVIVDSDDQLVSDAIEKIEKNWNKYKNSEICTMTFEHIYEDGTPMVEIKKTVIEKRTIYPVKYKRLGDYADVIITKYLKEYKFPTFENEKFLNEGDLLFYLSGQANSVFIDDSLIVGGYQNDGLTKNIRNLQIKNYNGSLYTATLSMEKKYPMWFRLKNAVLYDYITIKSDVSTRQALKKSKYPILTTIALLPALIYILLRK